MVIVAESGPWIGPYSSVHLRPIIDLRSQAGQIIRIPDTQKQALGLRASNWGFSIALLEALLNRSLVAICVHSLRPKHLIRLQGTTVLTKEIRRCPFLKRQKTKEAHRSQPDLPKPGRLRAAPLTIR